MDLVKVVLADSNELVRIGLRTILDNNADAEIVGEVVNREDLKSIVQNFGTQLVLIDYTSPGFSIDVIPELLELDPKINFVAITPDQSASTLVDALRSGVTSYIKKDCSLAEIVEAVNETGKGKKFFCGQILETIRKADIDVDGEEFESLSCEPIMLSNRETEIITLIADGYTNIQIANQLFLSNHTVNTHRKNIMGKLGVKNTAGIVMYAVKTNLVSPNKYLFTGES